MTQTIRWQQAATAQDPDPDSPLDLVLEYHPEGEWRTTSAEVGLRVAEGGGVYHATAELPEGVAIGLLARFERECCRTGPTGECKEPIESYTCTSPPARQSRGCSEDPCPTFVPELSGVTMLLAGVLALAVLARRGDRA